MKLRTLLLGLCAFALALLVVLPVRWVAGLLPTQVQCAGWRGSIWKGQCAGLRLTMPGTAPVRVEAVRWQMHPRALLHLALQADFQISDAEGNASGVLELQTGGRMLLREVALQAPFDRRFVAIAPAGWTGRLDAKHLSLQLQARQIIALSGELQLRNLDDGRGGQLGSYRLTFAPGAAAPYIGALQDTGGPLAVSASLTIAADRSWVLDGSVAARASAGAALQRSLDLLGAPDASGRRRLSAAGSLN